MQMPRNTSTCMKIQKGDICRNYHQEKSNMRKYTQIINKKINKTRIRRNAASNKMNNYMNDLISI